MAREEASEEFESIDAETEDEGQEASSREDGTDPSSQLNTSSKKGKKKKVPASSLELQAKYKAFACMDLTSHGLLCLRKLTVRCTSGCSQHLLCGNTAR